MTSHIEVRRPLPCARRDAATHLHRFFQANGSASGEFAMLRLKIKAGIARTVIASIQTKYVGAASTAHHVVQWAPEGGGPFPLFSGEIAIEGDDDAEDCTIVLRGKYETPLGLLGAAFDIVLGNQIARASATGLLKEIGSYVAETLPA